MASLSRHLAQLYQSIDTTTYTTLESRYSALKEQRVKVFFQENT